MLFRPFTAVTYIVLLLLAGCAEPGGGNPTNVDDCREITRLRKHDILSFSPSLKVKFDDTLKTVPTDLKVSIVVLTPGDTALPLLTLGSPVLINTTTFEFRMPLPTMIIPRRYIVHRPGSRFGVLCAALFRDVDSSDSCDGVDSILAVSRSVFVVSDVDETGTSPRTWWQWLPGDSSGVVVSGVYRQEQQDDGVFLLQLHMPVDERGINVPAPWLYPTGGVIVLQHGKTNVVRM
jgi:hypothetical protein